LEIKADAFEKIQNEPPQDNPKKNATIYYTRGFDMLKRDDRKDLIHILRYLLFLSKHPAVEYLPNKYK
jgi:hypothetical protein